MNIDGFYGIVFVLFKRKVINMSTDKKKNIIFSEEVDSSINGFALGTSFVLVALLVMYFEVFNNLIIERVVAIVLLLVGIAGTMSEIEKIKKNDIKGFGDLVLGLLFAIPSFVVIIKFKISLLNILMVFLFLFGVYGSMRGIFAIIYSLRIKKRESNNKKVEIMQIIVALTEIIALIVAVLQLISEV